MASAFKNTFTRTKAVPVLKGSVYPVFGFCICVRFLLQTNLFSTIFQIDVSVTYKKLALTKSN